MRRSLALLAVAVGMVILPTAPQPGRSQQARDPLPTIAPGQFSLAAADAGCTPPAEIYAHRRWRREHPARGRTVCATSETHRLKVGFWVYADRRFRSCAPDDCRRWAARFYGGVQLACLEALWGRESGWRRWADNPTSDAHGIPQANPGSKMGPGWQDDGKVQMRWGFGYIKGTYGSPCDADSRQSAQGWY